MISRLLKNDIAKNLARLERFIISPDVKFRSLARQLSAERELQLGFREK